jgi:hypothetical protein
MAADHEPVPPRRHRPRSATVFIAAFVAGAAAAVGINRALDVHLAQAKPQVECEPIFVALRSLPQGVAVTVWDVALRDWPKAMMPSAAVRVNDPFEGCLLKHPLREGQPLLTVQLLKPTTPVESPTLDEKNPEAEAEVFVPPVPATVATPAEADHPSPPSAAAVTDVSVPAMTVTSEPPPELLATADPQPEPASEATNETPITAESLARSEPVGQPAVEADVESVADTRTESLAEPESLTKPESLVEPTLEPQPMKDVAVEKLPAESVAGTVPPAAETVQPLPEPPRKPALAAVRQEPTPAAMVPSPSASPVTAPAPVTIGPQLLGQSAEAPSPIDLPSRPAADIASLPSVMARDGESSSLHASESSDSSVRYLVVPERIAQQADTSFTTPTAPGVSGVAAEQKPATSQQSPATQQQATRQPTRPQQTGTAQSTPRSPGRQAAGSRNPAAGGPVTAKQPPRNQQPRPADRAADEPKTWGGMFPNVSAGLEAITSWRSRSREAVADENPAAPPRR